MLARGTAQITHFHPHLPFPANDPQVGNLSVPLSSSLFVPFSPEGAVYALWVHVVFLPLPTHSQRRLGPLCLHTLEWTLPKAEPGPRT